MATQRSAKRIAVDRSKKNHQKNIARKEKNRKRKAALAKSGERQTTIVVQSPPIQQKQSVQLPETRVYDRRVFTVPATFPEKHPAVMEQVKEYERLLNASGDDAKNCDLDEDTAEAISQTIRRASTLSQADLETLNSSFAEQKVKGNELGQFVLFQLDYLRNLSDHDWVWDCSSKTEFDQDVALFQQFVEQDWISKIIEYALMKKQVTYNVTVESLSQPIRTEVVWEQPIS